MASSRAEGGAGWILRKTSSMKSSQALAQAALGRDGVTIPGSVQNTCGCGTWDITPGDMS